MSKDKTMVKPKPNTLKPQTDFSGSQVQAYDTDYTAFNKRPGSFNNVGKKKKGR